MVDGRPRALRSGIAGAILALALTPPGEARAQAETSSCEIPPQLAAERPGPDGAPTEIRIGLFILDVTHIEEVEQVFRTDVAFNARWTDPRLAAAALGHSLAGCPLVLDRIWNPELVFLNERGAPDLSSLLLSVDEEGRVAFRGRAYGDFSARLDLRDFPFDHQVLPITVVSRRTADEVRLVVDDERRGMMQDPFLTGWRIELGQPVADVFELPDIDRSIPRVEERLLAQRDSGFWLIKMLLPMGLVVMMAWIVFWIDPGTYPRQLGFSLTSILTLIAYHFTQTLMMPKISYLTRFDRFITGASVLVLLALVETTVAGTLAQRGREETALRLNLWSRWAFVVLLVLIGVFTLVI